MDCVGSEGQSRDMSAKHAECQSNYECRKACTSLCDVWTQAAQGAVNLSTHFFLPRIGNAVVLSPLEFSIAASFAFVSNHETGFIRFILLCRI